MLHIEEIHDADVLRQVAVLLERENARLHDRLHTLTAELAQLRGQDATTAQAQLAGAGGASRPGVAAVAP